MAAGRSRCVPAAFLLVSVCGHLLIPHPLASEREDPVASTDATGFVEKVDVSIVLVPVVVRDAAGRPVTDLTQTDFTVKEEGVAQPITSFGLERRPVSIFLALDTSPSMRPHELAVKRAALDFTRAQRPQTSFALAVFNDAVLLESDFAADRKKTESAIASVHSEGEATALYDAVTAATRALESRDEGRVAVVFTDGSDTVYPQDQEEVRLTSAIEMAHRRDVAVYTVAFGPRAATGILGRISKETGGELFSALTTRDLSAAFTGVADAVGNRYLLAYRNPGGAGQSGASAFHRIEVSVSRPGLRVSARSGYYAR